MKTRIDARLRQEHARFRLRFACPDCAHHDAEVAACSLGFPAECHQRTELGERAELVFCKAFELR